MTAADMVSNISSMTSAYVNMSTMDTLQSTMNVTVSTDLVTDQGGTGKQSMGFCGISTK